MTAPAPRAFAVSSAGVTSVLSEHDLLGLMGVPAAVSAAYDLLTDDGMPAQKAADLAMAAWRSGRDPEAFARKTVRLRKGLRGG